MPAGSRLTLAVPQDFSLPHAVCSYGYFLLEPNRWDHHTATFHRVLRGNRQRPLRVAIRQRHPDRLTITADTQLTRNETYSVKRDLTRMLRPDEDQSDWWAMHPEAKRRRFGPMFRSPSLFEDMVKTITGCNVTWKNTINMNRLLCARVPRIGRGGFPTPQQIVAFGPDRLKAACRVGYRADRIVRLAQSFLNGEINPDWYEDPSRTTDELNKALKKLHGIGDYAAANIAMLLGHYDRLAIDTETYRHYCLTTKTPRPKDPPGLAQLHKKIDAHYAQFQPYPFKAYWFELWRHYEERFGDAHTWDRDTTGSSFTASVLKD
ncbi:MAG: endonuclease III domain-containing protein [Planctomycetota bacterium]